MAVWPSWRSAFAYIRLKRALFNRTYVLEFATVTYARVDRFFNRSTPLRLDL